MSFVSKEQKIGFKYTQIKNKSKYVLLAFFGLFWLSKNPLLRRLKQIANFEREKKSGFADWSEKSNHFEDFRNIVGKNNLKVVKCYTVLKRNALM